jgi:hypothetical protein
MKKLESPGSVLEMKPNRFFDLQALFFSMPTYGGQKSNRYFSLQDLLLFPMPTFEGRKLFPFPP